MLPHRNDNKIKKGCIIMKKLVSLTLALVLIITCLSGIVFAADPIAKVVTGDKTVEVTTVDQLAAAIDTKGTSAVTLLKDVTITATMRIPTCKFDLNGHTVTGKDAAGAWIHPIYFDVAKTDDAATNLVSEITNGTIIGMNTVSCNVGALHASKLTLVANGGHGFQLTQVSSKENSLNKGKWNDSNIIEDCVAYVDRCALAYNNSGGDFSAVKFLIKNSTFVTKTENSKDKLLGCAVKEGLTTVPGTYELGENVNFYHPESTPVVRDNPTPTITGKELKKQDGTHAATVLDTKYEGLVLSTTTVPAPAQPETPAVPTTPAQPETPAAPSTPAQPTTPSVPTTTVPDVEVPKTGASVVALGVMALVSLAGAVISKKH